MATPGLYAVLQAGGGWGLGINTIAGVVKSLALARCLRDGLLARMRPLVCDCIRVHWWAYAAGVRAGVRVPVPAVVFLLALAVCVALYPASLGEGGMGDAGMC